MTNLTEEEEKEAKRLLLKLIENGKIETFFADKEIVETEPQNGFKTFKPTGKKTILLIINERTDGRN